MGVKHKYRWFVWATLAVALLFNSCNLIPHKKKEPTEKAIARVFDVYLYPNDIKDLVSKDTRPFDSVAIVREFIQHWMEEQVLIHQALNNLDQKQMDLSRQIEDYKNSLIIYAFEKEVVKEKLDTNVNEADIEKYYNDNKKDFQLKNDIVKIIYVKVGKKAPGLDKLKALVISDNPKDRDKLSKYCYQYAQNFFLNDNAWLMFDDVLKEIPIQTYNQDLFLQNNNNHYVQIEDTGSVYCLGIKGYMIKNSLSPLSFEKENIKKILLNQRKMDLIEAMKKDLYNQAQNHNDAQVY
ncbi:MAG: hypothetical protein ACLQQ4_15725 [Bacteroidia bacterium]